VLLVQIVVSAWFLHQHREQDVKHINQLLSLNSLSALMANHAVAISQLKLNEFVKLASNVERYQQNLDVLRPGYQQGESESWQTFKQLNDIWKPIREAASDLLAMDEKLRRLRAAVEDTDQRLPTILVEHDHVIDALRVALKNPARLRLLREQRLILHRMAANANAATASVLSAVNANARVALSDSIEADLFLLEKSLGIMVADNKATLAAVNQDDFDVSLLLNIDVIAEHLVELVENMRRVTTSLVVMRDMNKHAQLLIEDSGLLVRPVKQLIADYLRAARAPGKKQTWLYSSLALLLFWLFYRAYCHIRQMSDEKLALLFEKENLQTGVDSIARQIANFSEGDHAINASSKSIDCQHLVEQVNRMMAHVNSLDQKIAKYFLPLIKRVATEKSEVMVIVDREATNIARLSAEINNVVSGQMSGSTVLASQVMQTQAQLQSLLKQIDVAKKQLVKVDDSQPTEVTVHAVRQLHQHIDDRLRSLVELSQRINLEVIDLSSTLASRSGSDRVLRRAIEQLQSLTRRYHGQANDVAQLLNDMTLATNPLLQKMNRVEGITGAFERLQSSAIDDINKIDQGLSDFARTIAGADREQARHIEAIALILDALQEGNQRLSVAAVDSDVGIKQLNKLATEQLGTLKEPDAGDALDKGKKQ
ncbi:MAG: hypothetical protein JKY90_05820, partial [Gammaproteobacteria bacterium]|nr:hypothetical protein [Gammaproteobacteria bacterium]